MLHMGTMLLHDVSTNTSEVKLYKRNILIQTHINIWLDPLSRMPIYDMFETSKASI